MNGSQLVCPDLSALGIVYHPFCNQVLKVCFSKNCRHFYKALNTQTQNSWETLQSLPKEQKYHILSATHGYWFFLFAICPNLKLHSVTRTQTFLLDPLFRCPKFWYWLPFCIIYHHFKYFTTFSFSLYGFWR